jgi:hypothetical protein
MAERALGGPGPVTQDQRSGGSIRNARGSERGGSVRDRAAAAPPAPGLELVPARPFLTAPIVAWVDLSPGDRALVAPGEVVIAGTPLAERLRDPHLADGPVLSGSDERRPGDRVGSDAGSSRSLRRAASAAGELVFRSGRRWRIATGELADQVEAPASGIVREVRSGIGIAIELAGTAIPAAFGVGVPTRGRLAIGTDPGGELHATALDVGRAGTILVVGARIDAEALTRARAMGIRGVVVAALAGKELRDFTASEQRQRAALHRLPPFAVLVLDGIVRRPIAPSVMDLFERLEGREVGIVTDPPALLIAGDLPDVPPIPPDLVRVRSGPDAGREGQWLGLLGTRRFPPGVHLESGLVDLGDEDPVAVPLADLIRFT